jgi:hypothetical protein
MSDAATKALLGATMKEQSILEEEPNGDQPTEGARTAAVLKSFLNTVGQRAEPIVMLRTRGQHGFNGLPNHPSLDRLKGKDSAETAAKVEKHLIQKGETLKNTELSAERAAWLFDQEIQKELDRAWGDDIIAELQKGAKAHRPAAAMKPADLTQAIKEAFAGFTEVAAESQTKAWEEKEKTAGKPVTADQRNEKKAKLQKNYAESATTGVKATLIRDLGAPEFVIADTNWGSPSDKTLFVIIPDPATGEPIMWEKTIPPGSLKPAGREWVDKGWAHIS